MQAAWLDCMHPYGHAGDPRRLIYSLDSRGLLCGTNNTYRSTFVDLTDKPNLYYLNVSS